jgi:hypothetical protein
MILNLIITNLISNTREGHGCAKNSVRAFEGAREEQGVPEALSDGGSARREGRVYMILVFFSKYRNIF